MAPSPINTVMKNENLSSEEDSYSNMQVEVKLEEPEEIETDYDKRSITNNNRGTLSYKQEAFKNKATSEDSQSSSIEYRFKMENKTIQQLKAELKKRNLSTQGTKRQLLHRILELGKKSHLVQAPSRRGVRVNTLPNKNIPTEDNQHLVGNSRQKNISINSRVKMLQAQEWDLIQRAKDLIEKERSLLKKEMKLWDKLKLLETTQPPQIKTPAMICSVSEIADMLPLFSPGQITSMSAEEWVNQVENLTRMFGWDERALFLAAVSKLQGQARYWWDISEEHTLSWDQLVAALKLNFPNKYSEFEVHQELVGRVRQPEENFEKYCLEINMLGKRINLSDKAIIRYILTGLNDRQMTLSLAAGNFKNTSELVEKIKYYESICKNTTQRLF